MTKQELHHAILRGQAAIEDCLLHILLQPWKQSTEGEAEFSELKALLKQYNLLLGKHMLQNITVNAANDETGDLL